MGSFELLEEKYKKLERYFNSKEYQRKLRKLYSNRRVAKKQVRELESRVAKSIAKVEFGVTPSDSFNLFQLEMDMEWFLTWRVELGRFPYIMWCDGVAILLLKKLGKRSYYIKAKIWLGPEADTNIVSLCEMEGMLRLNTRLEGIRSYELRIAYLGQVYSIRKAI